MYDYTYYGYGYDTTPAATGLAAFGVGMLIFWLIGMAISVFTLICMWKVFKKAGKPGWASLIPIYNIIVMLEIAELPMWYIALYCLPFANIYAMFKTYIELAKKFGKSAGFGVGMVFLAPIFFGILAFGKDSNYVGGQNNVQPTYQQAVQPQQPVMQQPINPTPVQPVAPVMQEPVQPVQPVMPQPVEPVIQQPTMPQEPVQPQPVSPAFCTNCGAPIAPNTAFCTNCGKQI